MRNNKKLEALAELEHKQWAHWTEHMLDNITSENVKRWRDQIATPYSLLTEEEKESDRKWARRVLAIIDAETTKDSPPEPHYRMKWRG